MPWSPWSVVSDRYRLRQPLHAGIGGCVWQADDLVGGHPVAIKFAPENVEDASAWLAVYQREIAATSAIRRHRNVLTGYACGTFGGRPYAVFEYVPGRTLEWWIEERRERRRPISIRRAAQIMKGVLDGMVVLHAAGVAHQDIKPANIIITPLGDPVIVDFGLSCREGSDYHPRPMAGTPLYMAPERFAGHIYTFDDACLADVYSVGAVFFRLVTGECPFNGERTHEVVDLVRWIKTPLASSRRRDVPAALDQIIFRAMAKRPTERYQTCREMLVELRGFLRRPAAQQQEQRA